MKLMQIHEGLSHLISGEIDQVSVPTGSSETFEVRLSNSSQHSVLVLLSPH